MSLDIPKTTKIVTKPVQYRHILDKAEFAALEVACKLANASGKHHFQLIFCSLYTRIKGRKPTKQTAKAVHAIISRK